MAPNFGRVLDDFGAFATKLGRFADGFDASAMKKLSNITDFLKGLDFGKLDPKTLQAFGDLKNLKSSSAGLDDADDFAKAMDDVAAAMITKGDPDTIIKNIGNFSETEVDVLMKRMDEFSPVEKANMIGNLEGQKRGKFAERAFQTPDERVAILKKISEDKTSGTLSKKMGDFADGLDATCRRAPTICTIGRGLTYLGVGTATVVGGLKLYEYLDDDNTQECMAACLPTDWDESEESGYGDKKWKDLNFRTYEQLQEDYGDSNIDSSNQPLCTKNTTNCKKMCSDRCGELNKSFMDRVLDPAKDLTKSVAEGAGDVASSGLSAFLEGIFGDGMGIVAIIGFVIFVVIIMVVMM